MSPKTRRNSRCFDPNQPALFDIPKTNWASWCGEKGGCVCDKYHCLYSWTGRCRGRCDYMGCRGGMFYQSKLPCVKRVEYDETKTKVRECLKANIVIYQDGYIDCCLVENFGCEACYMEWREKREREKQKKQDT
jgi:hypothetical protein